MQLKETTVLWVECGEWERFRTKRATSHLKESKQVETNRQQEQQQQQGKLHDGPVICIDDIFKTHQLYLITSFLIRNKTLLNYSQNHDPTAFQSITVTARSWWFFYFKTTEWIIRYQIPVSSCLLYSLVINTSYGRPSPAGIQITKVPLCGILKIIHPLFKTLAS